MTREDTDLHCPGLIDTHGPRTISDNGAVHYKCPICDRKNRWVFSISKDGKEVGHLAPSGPKSRAMVDWGIKVPRKLQRKLDRYDDELVRLHLDELPEI